MGWNAYKLVPTEFRLRTKVVKIVCAITNKLTANGRSKPAIPYGRTCLGVSMLLLCAKPGFGVIIQASSVLQFPFLGQLGIDIHDHGCVCVSHPGLQSLDLDAGFIACRAEGDTEIMTADLFVIRVCIIRFS